MDATGQSGMILAAGLGTRLRPLTLHRPKPLLEVLGRPLITYALDNAVRMGLSQVAINLHHLGDQVQKALGDSYKTLKISYLTEEVLLGTGGGIKNAEPFLKQSPVPHWLVLNSDIIIDLDTDGLRCRWEETGPDVLMVLRSAPDIEQYGIIGTDDQGRITQILDMMCPGTTTTQKRMFCGNHMFSPRLFDYFRQQEPASVIQQCYQPMLLDQSQMVGFEHSGYFCDVGTPERLWQANMDLLPGQTKLKYLNPFEGLEQKGENIWIAPSARIDPNVRIQGPALIDEGARIGAASQIGPFSIIGKRSEVQPKSHIAQSVIHSGTNVTRMDVNRTIEMGDISVPVA